MMFVLIISIFSIEFLIFNKFDVWNAMANFNMWFINLGIEFVCKYFSGNTINRGLLKNIISGIKKYSNYWIILIIGLCRFYFI